MSDTIPATHRDLVDNPVHVTLVTVMPDGQPQASVVWCNADGDDVLVNTARGRQKEKNMVERPQATLLWIDPENPYRYLEVRGEVTEITEDGAVEHINSLAQQYMGKATYFGDVMPAEALDRETRVVFRIRPKRVVTMGS